MRVRETRFEILLFFLFFRRFDEARFGSAYSAWQLSARANTAGAYGWLLLLISVRARSPLVVTPGRRATNFDSSRFITSYSLSLYLPFYFLCPCSPRIYITVLPRLSSPPLRGSFSLLARRLFRFFVLCRPFFFTLPPSVFPSGSLSVCLVCLLSLPRS